MGTRVWKKTQQLSTLIIDLGIVGDFTFFFIVFQIVWLFLGVQISPLQSYKNVECRKEGKEVGSWTSTSSQRAWVRISHSNVGALVVAAPWLWTVTGSWKYPTHTGRSCWGCPPFYRPGIFMSLMSLEVKFSSYWPLHFPQISWNLL